MATFYFRAAAGSWGVAGTWSDSSGGASNGAVPDATTDCVLDAGSGANVLTVDGTSGTPNLCRSLVCTGFTGTLTQGSGAQINIGDGTAGAFTIVSGMTYTPNGASLLKFVSTTTGNNITFGGKTFGPMTFDGVGGEWTFQSTAVFPTNNPMITLTRGHLNTNGQSVTCAQFSSSNSNTRALTLGTTTWTSANNTGIWDISTSTGMTLSAASSSITSTTTTSGYTFHGGGLTYGTLSCTTLTTGTFAITGANTFGTLTLSQGANTTGQFTLAGNQTVSGTFTSNGNSVINRVYIRSSVRGTPRTISAGTVTVTNIDLQDIVGAGAGSWNISAVTGLSGDCGGNSSITFTTPANQYWVTSGGTSTGNESAVTRWANASGGTAGTGRSPLPQDTAYFDANSIDAGSRTITQDKPRIGPHIWTGATNTPTWTRTAVASVFGNVTYIAGMTPSGTGNQTYEGRSNSTLTSAGLTLPNAYIIDAVDGVGTLTQGDSLTTSSTFTMTSGTFAGASTYTATFTTFTFNGGTFSPSGTTTLSGAFAMNSGTLTQTQVFTGATTLNILAGTFTLDRNLTLSAGMTLRGGTLAGGYTVAGTTIAFTTAAATTYEGRTMTLTGTTVTVNGAGTNNVGTITATGAMTSELGTMNLYGTLTVDDSDCLFVPQVLGYPGGGIFNSSIIKAA